MDTKIPEISFQELKRSEKRKQKNVLIINSLGGISLSFSLVSMFLILALLISKSQNELTYIGLIFSTILFSLIGIICGTIGFLKARIHKKGGYYATTGTVLNLFGIIINALEIIGTIAVILFSFL